MFLGALAAAPALTVPASCLLSRVGAWGAGPRWSVLTQMSAGTHLPQSPNPSTQTAVLTPSLPAMSRPHCTGGLCVRVSACVSACLPVCLRVCVSTHRAQLLGSESAKHSLLDIPVSPAVCVVAGVPGHVERDAV